MAKAPPKLTLTGELRPVDSEHSVDSEHTVDPINSFNTFDTDEGREITDDRPKGRRSPDPLHEAGHQQAPLEGALGLPLDEE